MVLFSAYSALMVGAGKFCSEFSITALKVGNLDNSTSMLTLNWHTALGSWEKVLGRSRKESIANWRQQNTSYDRTILLCWSPHLISLEMWWQFTGKPVVSDFVEPCNRLKDIKPAGKKQQTTPQQLFWSKGSGRGVRIWSITHYLTEHSQLEPSLAATSELLRKLIWS